MCCGYCKTKVKWEHHVFVYTRSCEESNWLLDLWRCCGSKTEANCRVATTENSHILFLKRYYLSRRYVWRHDVVCIERKKEGGTHAHQGFRTLNQIPRYNKVFWKFGMSFINIFIVRIEWKRSVTVAMTTINGVLLYRYVDASHILIFPFCLSVYTAHVLLVTINSEIADKCSTLRPFPSPRKQRKKSASGWRKLRAQILI